MQSVTNKPKPIPQGYHSVTPYLAVKEVPRLITFLKQAFDAEERERMTTPDGRVSHAEMKIGDSIVMMGEPTGESKSMPGMIYLYFGGHRRCIQESARGRRNLTESAL